MRRQAGVAVFMAFAATCCAALAASSDPPVPPGLDPGGLAVAIVGRGLDYTQPHVAQRLARDGEGEIIGYDLIDADRRPFAVSDADMKAAELILGEGQTTKLVVIRVDVASKKSTAQGIGAAATMPAPIITVLAMPRDADMAQFLSTVSKRMQDTNFIVPSAGAGAPIDLPNITVVSAISEAITTDNPANLAVPVAPGAGAGERAVGRVAALAARLLAVEPHIRGAALKARLIGLAEPAQSGRGAPVIREPSRHFWLE
ncbi:MAG: hypothetical protein ACT4OU_00395 [Hyphomicrobium sp.]